MKLAVPLIAALLSHGAHAQFFNDFDGPPHDYWTAPMQDPMSVLVRGAEAGEVKLPGGEGLPLVLRLLEELDIPVESQVLVFSRTSLQRKAVSPANPRAIYFNEETYVGWMPGGRIEIASCDPERGAVFFFQRELGKQDGPRFFRDPVCIQCHAGSATNFLPGLLARSVYPDARGRSLRAVESFERVGHGVPMHDRWGGWYVTGGPAGLAHMGNALAARGDKGVEMLPPEGPAGKFDPAHYPRPDSDVVALLVFDHQVSMQYELMQASYVGRQVAADAGWDEAGPPGALPEAVAEEVGEVAERVVRHLLFCGEAALGAEKIAGAGDFEKAFLARAKRDPEGRSLRDLRMRDRMFEHRCSFMVHSSSFAGMPGLMRSAVIDRLRTVLTSEEVPEGYGHLPAAERKAIYEILEATLEGFAAAS